jgi:hypothetical protein
MRSDADYESDDEASKEPLFKPQDRDRIFESLTEEPSDKTKKADPPPVRVCPMCHGQTLVSIPVVAGSPVGSPQRAILPKQ